MFCGIDCGSISTDVALLTETGELAASCIVPTGNDPQAAMREAVVRAGELCGITETAIAYCVACGYGRHMASCAHRAVTEITAHATGARYFFPEATVVIDIGGEDTKAIAIDAAGHVADFLMNNKCAAGTGRFLEAIAARLECTLESFIAQACAGAPTFDITSTCTVFAESEVVTLLSEGKSLSDIAAAVHRAIVKRVVGMSRPLISGSDVVLTGGVAHNAMIARVMRDEYGFSVRIPEEPQLVGAVGAALLAKEYSSCA